MKRARFAGGMSNGDMEGWDGNCGDRIGGLARENDDWERGGMVVVLVVW